MSACHVQPVHCSEEFAHVSWNPMVLTVPGEAQPIMHGMHQPRYLKPPCVRVINHMGSVAAGRTTGQLGIS